MSGYHEFYMLDGKTAVPCTEEQCQAWRRSDREKRAAGKPYPSRVALTKIGDVTVSTVFLWLNHGYDGGPPMIFETMVFGGPLAGDCERRSTWEEAEATHAEMVRQVKEAI